MIGVPAGWDAPEGKNVSIGPGENITLGFDIHAPADASGRHVVSLSASYISGYETKTITRSANVEIVREENPPMTGMVIDAIIDNMFMVLVPVLLAVAYMLYRRNRYMRSKTPPWYSTIKKIERSGRRG